MAQKKGATVTWIGPSPSHRHRTPKGHVYTFMRGIPAILTDKDDIEVYKAANHWRVNDPDDLIYIKDREKMRKASMKGKKVEAPKLPPVPPEPDFTKVGTPGATIQPVVAEEGAPEEKPEESET